MVNKILYDVDNDAWRVFSGYCKAKNKKMGRYISDLIKKEVKEKGDKFVA